MHYKWQINRGPSVAERVAQWYCGPVVVGQLKCASLLVDALGHLCVAVVQVLKKDHGHGH